MWFPKRLARRALYVSGPPIILVSAHALSVYVFCSPPSGGGDIQTCAQPLFVWTIMTLATSLFMACAGLIAFGIGAGAYLLIKDIRSDWKEDIRALEQHRQERIRQKELKASRDAGALSVMQPEETGRLSMEIEG